MKKNFEILETKQVQTITAFEELFGIHGLFIEIEELFRICLPKGLFREIF